MGRYLRNKKGFTLIEVAISVGILAFVLCGIVSSLVGFMSLSQLARDKTVAVNDAQQVMEKIWDTSFSNITSVDWTDWAANNGCNTLRNEQVNVTYDVSVVDLLKITVTVTWQTKNRPMSISLISLRTKG